MTLLRKEIGRRLAAYYAQSADLVVGSTPASVPMKSLWGEWHWRRVYRNLYEEQNGQWLTPVELFKPYYSRIIANFIVESIKGSAGAESRLEVVELGGGRGTNAQLILDHLECSRPDVYERVKYRIFDSSLSLHQYQKEKLGNSNHAERVQVELVDMMAVAEGESSFLESSDATTVVIAMELLDNLPHDKIRVRAGRVEQACVVETVDEGMIERFEPLSDDLLKRVLLKAPTYKRQNVTWVPTIACGLIERLSQERPDARLLLADFDWLPSPDRLHASGDRRSLWADGEPLVTSMEDVDYECYLNAPILCDILFPTDFRKLSAFARRSWRTEDVRVEAQKQADFLTAFGKDQVDSTSGWLTGYNPMLHDFGNCSMMTVIPKSTATLSGK